MGLFNKKVDVKKSYDSGSNRYVHSSNDFNLLGFNDIFSDFHKKQNLKEIIDSGYGSSVIVYSIINKIVNAAKDVKLKLVDSKGDVVESGELYDLIQEPGIYRGQTLNLTDFIEASLVYLLNSGNVYYKKLNITGFNKIQGLEVIPSQLVKPKVSNSYLSQNNGYIIYDINKEIPLTNEEVAHIKYFNPTSVGLNSNVGLSPLQAGLYALTGSLDVQKALSVLVKNQGVRGILTNESDRNLDPTLLGKIKQKINNTIRGIDKINSVHVSNTKMKYIPMGMSATDLKLLESGVLTDRQICNLFGVDSKLFNDVSSSTFNNLTEANKSLYQNTVLPNLKKITNALNSAIIKDYNNNKQKYQLVIDKDSIPALQSDKAKESSRQRLIADGINRVLASNTDRDGKINTLIYVFGMTQEQANNIVSNG